jgi:hypothetical protein
MPIVYYISPRYFVCACMNVTYVYLNPVTRASFPEEQKDRCNHNFSKIMICEWSLKSVQNKQNCFMLGTE